MIDNCRYLHKTAKYFQNHTELQVLPGVKVKSPQNSIYIPIGSICGWLVSNVLGEEGDKSATLKPGSEHQVFRFTFPDSARETFIHHNSVNVKFASHSFLAVVNMGMWWRAGWESVLGLEWVVDVWVS